MQIVGRTTELYAYIASNERKFRINEILIVEDENFGPVKVEVIETFSFNHFIPMASEKNKFADSEVLEALKQVGFEIDNEEVNVAKVRTMSELTFPLKTSSKVRLPSFEEVKGLLIKDDKGLNLGILRGTEGVASTMSNEFKNLSVLYDREHGIIEPNEVPFLFDYRSMQQYPHIGIFGGSGSGKSYAMRVMLEELMLKRIPTIVFDPHYEMDFKDKFSSLPDKYVKDFTNRYEIFTLGEDVGIDFTELNINDVCNLVSSASGGYTENMDNIVRTLHVRNETAESFQKKINALVNNLENKRELERKYENREQLNEQDRLKIEYEYQVVERYKDAGFNMSGLKAVQWRFNRLVNSGLFRGNAKPIVEALEGRKLAVIRGNMENLKMFSSYILNKTYNLRRTYKDEKQKGRVANWFPPFIIATDEAHNFAHKHFDSASKKILREISQEGRKYGVFLILASQRPALLDDTIIAQLSHKFIFKTNKQQDIQSLSEETDMTATDQKRLIYLDSGECLVSSTTMGRTVPVKIRAALTQPPSSINAFDELEDVYEVNFNPIKEAILKRLPIKDMDLFKIISNIAKEDGIIMSVDQIKSTLKELVDEGILVAKEEIFGNTYTLP